MNQREEYRSIHQNNLRFLREAKNLTYITNKNAIPYHIVNIQNVDVSDASLKRIQNLFRREFLEYETCVSIVKGLAFSSPSLLFQINQKNGIKLYESITISISESEEKNGTVSWPLLIVLKQCKKHLIPKIHSFIQRTLKCILRPIKLTELQTIWLIGISICESLRRNLNCGMSLTCQLPTQTPAEIDIYFNDEVLFAMWESLHDSMNDVVHLEEIEVFFTQMTSHINNVYNINLSQLSINSFLLKGIGLQFQKQFQINVAKAEIIYLLLSYIVSDCLSTD